MATPPIQSQIPFIPPTQLQPSEEEQKFPQVSSSSSSGALPPTAPPRLLPKTLSLDELASTSHVENPHRVTVEQIQNAVEKHDFFTLRTYLQQTIAAEYAEKLHDIGLRNEFFKAFTYLQETLKSDLPQLKKGEGEFENWTSQKRKEFELFITEGRGGESIQVFAKVPLTLNPHDPDYGSKIMKFANNTWHFRQRDIIPGTNTPLAEKKADVSLSEELLIPERVALKEKTLQDALTNFAILSNRLMPYFQRYGIHVRIFLRGMLGAGKTYFLERVLSISEKDTACADAVKKTLGGNLAHHESVSIHDLLGDPETTKNIPYLMSVKTNVRESDNFGRGKTSGLCAPKDGRAHVIYDLAVSLEEATQRIHKRAEGGVRIANDQEIRGSYEDSIKNRPAIIKAALENEKISWYLYYRGELIAQIERKQLSVISSKSEELKTLKENDSYLNSALEKIPFTTL